MTEPMITKLTPLHQILQGDQICYYQEELVDSDRRAHHQGGMYTATVLKKVRYSVVLTAGELKPKVLYRVVVPTSVSSFANVGYASREKPKMIRGISID
jgi:hypothetical protein